MEVGELVLTFADCDIEWDTQSKAGELTLMQETYRLTISGTDTRF